MTIKKIKFYHKFEPDIVSLYLMKVLFQILSVITNKRSKFIENKKKTIDSQIKILRCIR